MSCLCDRGILREMRQFVVHVLHLVPRERQAARQSFDIRECIACPQVIDGRPLRAGCFLAYPGTSYKISGETLPSRNTRFTMKRSGRNQESGRMLKKLRETLGARFAAEPQSPSPPQMEPFLSGHGQCHAQIAAVGARCLALKEELDLRSKL